MVRRLIHTSGIVVCEERYLVAMKELQAEADAGRRAHRDAGPVAAIVSMKPYEEQKYAYCDYCGTCHLIIVSADDVIPSDQIPRTAK
jgi:hypothetical protein